VPASLRTHLSLSFLAILLLGMGVAALLAWRSVEKLYIDTQRENLLAQANLTASFLQNQPMSVDLAEPYSQAANVQPGIHTRLLSEQGAVLIGLPLSSSEITALSAENNTLISTTELLERSEIAQALQGQPATAVRSVASARHRRCCMPQHLFLAMTELSVV